MGEKMPWYVRFNNYMDYIFDPQTKKFKQILSLIIVLVTGLFYMVIPKIIYEEAYDMQFYDYIEDKLKEVADIVIEEGRSLYLDKIPDTVLEYDIKYTEQGIKFNYVLDNEKIISEYYSKIGKIPNESYIEKEIEMEMNIEISKDFQIISETTLSTVPTNEYYKRWEPISRILTSMIFGILSVFVIFLVLLLFYMGTYTPSIVWLQNHTN